SNGRLVKTDSYGHRADHAVVGRQSILWDIAGACVEWDLDRNGRGNLFNQFQSAGRKIDLAVLRCFELAYASFRVGQVTLCRGLEPGSSREYTRLASACGYYSCYIRGLLSGAHRWPIRTFSTKPVTPPGSPS